MVGSCRPAASTFATGPGFGLIGRALDIGVVCDRASAFCFAEYTSNNTSQALFVGHELGHLWNGRHCDNDPFSGCVGVGSCLMMCSTIGSCDNTGGVEFGTCNAARVIAHRDSRTCLEPGTTDINWVTWFTCPVPPLCPEDGSLVLPWHTLAGAVTASPVGGTVIIYGGGSSANAGGIETFPLTISKPLTIRAAFPDEFGPAVIGP